MHKHCSPNTDFYVTETNSLKDDHLNTNSNVLYPISTVTGPDFNNKEIFEQESESVLLEKIVSVLILIINRLVKVW